jgi:multidrug transporter EmrE-like cation transporter
MPHLEKIAGILLAVTLTSYPLGIAWSRIYVAIGIAGIMAVGRNLRRVCVTPGAVLVMPFPDAC